MKCQLLVAQLTLKIVHGHLRKYHSQSWRLLGFKECVPLGSKKEKLLNQLRFQQFREVETQLKKPNLVSGLQGIGCKPTRYSYVSWHLALSLTLTLLSFNQCLLSNY